MATFTELGVGQFQPTVGRQMILPGSAVLTGMDLWSDVLEEFAGVGMWEIDADRFPLQLRAADATVLDVA